MRIKGMIISILVKYGKYGAGMPSYRGAYEPPVPDCLKKKTK